MKSGIEFGDFIKFQKNMKNAIAEYDGFLENFMLEMGLRVLRRTKKNTPKITGALRAAWRLSEPRIKPASVEIDIINGQNYATFLEYGTCRGIEPHYMVTIPINEILDEMPTRFHSQFKAYLRKKGAL